ncbi:MAG TPA: phage portal protein [Micromonosporaceae bacterium]|nr:phage portal protein [Micromonosporaceae bacterium]
MRSWFALPVRRGRQELAWPVGPGAVLLSDRFHGHDQSQFRPAEYGDYVVTSNEVYSVVSLRARMMSSLPLVLYRGRGAEKERLDDHPAAQLLRRVNDYWTWPRLCRMDELSMGLWGQSFWALEPTRPEGPPANIWWLKPDRMRPVPHESDYFAKTGTAWVYEPLVGGPLIEFNAREIVWFRYPNPLDEFSPLSPLAAARLAADTGAAMQQSNQNLFSQGLHMGGFVVPETNAVTFSEEQAEDLERQIDRRFRGVDKAHKWGVLRYEARFQPMHITPRDAEYVSGMNVTLRQVCNAYGVPSSLLNDLNEANLAILDGLTKAMWAHTLLPDAEMRAAEVTEQYLPQFGVGAPDHCEPDRTAVPALQEAESEVWAREAQALDRGAITINEWRRLHGMPAVEWGDVYWAPVNKVPVDSAEMPQQPATAGGKPPDDERNPANRPSSPREPQLDHHAARALLAAITPINGARL